MDTVVFQKFSNNGTPIVAVFPLVAYQARGELRFSTPKQTPIHLTQVFTAIKSYKSLAFYFESLLYNFGEGK